MGIITAGSTGADSLDKYMITLPLYHSSALILGLATVIIYGKCFVSDHIWIQIKSNSGQ